MGTQSLAQVHTLPGWVGGQAVYCWMVVRPAQAGCCPWHMGDFFCCVSISVKWDNLDPGEQDGHRSHGAFLQTHHPLQCTPGAFFNRAMNTVQSPTDPFSRSLSSFGRANPPKTGVGEGWEPELPLLSPLPGSAFAAGSPRCSSHDAAKCALCQGLKLGLGLGEGQGALVLVSDSGLEAPFLTFKEPKTSQGRTS